MNIFHLDIEASVNAIGSLNFWNRYRSVLCNVFRALEFSRLTRTFD